MPMRLILACPRKRRMDKQSTVVPCMNPVLHFRTLWKATYWLQKSDTLRSSWTSVSTGDSQKKTWNIYIYIYIYICIYLHTHTHIYIYIYVCVCRKISPITGLEWPKGSRKMSFSDYMTTAQDGGKVVSLTYRPPLPPRKYSWYSFLLEAESTPGP